MSVCCECYVLSGRVPCVWLITRPEESYRVWCVWVWSWILDNETMRTWPTGGWWAMVENKTYLEIRYQLNGNKHILSDCPNKEMFTDAKSFFFPVPPHVLSNFVVFPPPPPRLWLKCNRRLRLGRPVGAVTLSRWEWWWNERWICGARGGGLKPNFYQLPRPWSPWASSPTHMVEPGIEPGTSWLVVRSSDHQATRLVRSKKYLRLCLL